MNRTSLENALAPADRCLIGMHCCRKSITRRRAGTARAISCAPVGFPSGAGSRGSATAEPTPVVFVVDDDVSVRESLELLIRAEGWQPETFGSAREFLSHPRVLAPGCLVLDVHLPDLSEITVKAHRGKVMRKMKAGSLADLVRMAARLGVAPVRP